MIVTSLLRTTIIFSFSATTTITFLMMERLVHQLCPFGMLNTWQDLGALSSLQRKNLLQNARGIGNGLHLLFVLFLSPLMKPLIISLLVVFLIVCFLLYFRLRYRFHVCLPSLVLLSLQIQHHKNAWQLGLSNLTSYGATDLGKIEK